MNQTVVTEPIWDAWDYIMLALMFIIIVIACVCRPGRGGIFRHA